MKNKFLYSLLAVSLCCINFSHAETSSQSCDATLQEMDAQLKILQSNVKKCRASKSDELNSFKEKRQQYLRLISLVEHYRDIFDENDLLVAMKERDILLGPKLKDYEECVRELMLIKLPVIPKPSGESCTDLAAGQKAFAELNKYEYGCHKCSIATIGEGYEKSPIEILVDQTNDSRRLRNAMYEKVSQENAKFSFEDKNQIWQLMRDIVVPHIEDVASEMAVSPSVLELLEWLGDSIDFRESFDAGTDAAISAYAAMTQLLMSKPKKINPLVVELQTRLSAVVTALPDDFGDLAVARAYAGQDPSQLTQGVLQLNDEQRKVLMQNINTAVKLYRQWK